jgi:hypothetical protein
VTNSGIVCRFDQKIIDMRELDLLETIYLAGGLVLSLLLPFMMSFSGPLEASDKKCCMKTVWAAQGLLALAGLAVLMSATDAPFAAACGLLGCIGCAFVLLRRFQAVDGV